MTNSQVWTNPWAFSSEITLGLCSSWSNISQTSLALAEQIPTELLPQPPPPPPVLHGMHQKNEEHEKEQGAFVSMKSKPAAVPIPSSAFPSSSSSINRQNQTLHHTAHSQLIFLKIRFLCQELRTGSAPWNSFAEGQGLLHKETS